MIFCETEDGLEIHIAHHDVMCMGKEQFIDLIVFGRNIYRSHANADVDDDDSDGE